MQFEVVVPIKASVVFFFCEKKIERAERVLADNIHKLSKKELAKLRYGNR